MADEILIVDNTVEEITVQEFSGAPTGTIITSTHGMDRGDQHTIRDIVGLKTKLHDIEKLHQVRSNLSGHADYYQWGEEATENNPIGPGYFVRLGADGKIHKCTNETVILRPTDLTLDKDEQGQVIIYALAGNIATADINKYYVVGTQVPYDIYAYDGVEYVKKSAYSYDGEKVVKICHTTDALGVTVSSAGFVGNDENITGTYTSAKADDPSRYALVATTGVVDVLCDHSILVGDYVFPTVGGWAAKSTGSYGYLVTALVPSINDTLYARIVLSPSMVNAKRVSDNVDYLLAETQRIGENVVKAVSDAQTALDEVRDSGNNLSDRVNNFESSMNAMGEQLYTNTVAVGNANTTAANAETIANQAKEYVQEVANSATGGASEALAIAKTLEGEMKALSEDMDTYSSKIDTIEDNQSTQATMISKANDDIAAVQTKATNLENSVTSLANKDTELANTMSLIDQKANEQGASITALTSKIDKYSVGEYSQAYGLTQAQAADILEAGKIVFIPTDFVSSDASFTEIYNPVEIETWITTDKNTKYIYSDGTYYYYHNGSQWTSISISDGQTAGYCITRFIEGYSYVWGGQKWLPETQSQNVFFTDTAPTAISTVSPLYWVVGAGYEGTDYKVGALYLYKNSAWSEVALGTSNSMSRTVALVTQTQNSWQTAISNVNGDMAALSAKVDENGSNVAMVASVVKEVEGVNLDFADNAEKTPYASKDDIVSVDKTKYFVVGTKAPYDIYYYDGTTYVQKINWSYDGQRVLQPNAASIVASANEAGTGVKIDANHINFDSDTFTVNTGEFKIKAGIIDFDGNDYKINADRIELAGSTTFSNYAQLEDVIKEQKVEYTKSTSNITLEGEVVWGSDYPIRDSGEYIWRKTTIIKGNDTKLTPIIECITPVDGKDGTSVAIKGTADSITQQGDLWQITHDGGIVVNATLGDGYMYNGDLYVCVQVIDGVDLFSNVGQIQGPQGISGASLQIIYKAQDTVPDIPTGANPSGWWTTIPASGVIYMSQKLSNATVWSSPVRISGETGAPGSDGAGVKYVYYLIPEDKTLPTKPTFENGALVTITGWTEQPSGVTEKRQYEYVSVSTETQKVEGNESIQNWINFSDPVVWSKWGEKGQDGDGVEYLYCLQADNTNPPTITINYGDEPTSPWTDEPTGTSESKPYEYVVQVKSTDPKGSTYTGKLWGVYDGMMALYCASTSIPTTPVGAGSNASTSENTKWQINIPAISGSQSIWVSYKTFLGANWSTPIKASAKDGPTGATIKSIETYYLVTKTDNAPPDPESGVEEGSGKWNTSIENWGKKDGTDIYQYLWVREKMTMDDANSTIIWTNPRLDASMTTIGQWCTENNKTIINGGSIGTGSITSVQLSTDAIKSNNYNSGKADETDLIPADGFHSQVGTFLDLSTGSIYTPKFGVNGETGELNVDKLSSFSADLGEITAGSIQSENYDNSTGVVVWGEATSNAEPEEELAPSEGLAYALSTDKTYYSVSRGNCTATDIIIPTTYNGLPVTTIGYSAFEDCSNLTSVMIPNSVTSINTAAFCRCSGLTSITIPDSVTSIGEYAFEDCSGLTYVVISSSVISIDEGAFRGCSGLTRVYYTGSSSDWEGISIGEENEPLSSVATRYYYSETEPTDNGNYWHYKGVNGFKISCADHHMIDSQNFKVTQNGDMTATSGKIGGWQIEENGLVGPNSEVRLLARPLPSILIFPNKELDGEVELSPKVDEDLGETTWVATVTLEEEYMQTPNNLRSIILNDIILTDSFQCIYVQNIDCRITDLDNDTTYDDSVYVSYFAYFDPIQCQIIYKRQFNIELTDDPGSTTRTVHYQCEIPRLTMSLYSEYFCLVAGTTGSENGTFSVTNTGRVNMIEGQLGGLTIDNSGIESVVDGERQFILTPSGLALQQNGASISTGGLSIYSDDDKAYISTTAPMVISGSNETAIELMSKHGGVEGTFDYQMNLYGTIEYRYVWDGLNSKYNKVPNIAHLHLETQDETTLKYPRQVFVNYQIRTRVLSSKPNAVHSKGTLVFDIRAGLGCSNTVSLQIGDDLYMRFQKYDGTWSDDYLIDEFHVNDVARFDQTISYKNIIVTGNIIPSTTEMYNLGESASTRKWQNIYATTFHGEDCIAECCTSSDANLKNSIQDLTPEYEQIFDELHPVTFKYNDGTSGRTHIGMIAQEVERAANNAGIATDDFASVVVDNGKYYLRYSEFIALCIDQIQKLKARATEQENIINDLTNRLIALEEKLK